MKDGMTTLRKMQEACERASGWKHPPDPYLLAAAQHFAALAEQGDERVADMLDAMADGGEKMSRLMPGSESFESNKRSEIKALRTAAARLRAHKAERAEAVAAERIRCEEQMVTRDEVGVIVAAQLATAHAEADGYKQTLQAITARGCTGGTKCGWLLNDNRCNACLARARIDLIPSPPPAEGKALEEDAKEQAFQQWRENGGDYPLAAAKAESLRGVLDEASERVQQRPDYLLSPEVRHELRKLEQERKEVTGDVERCACGLHAMEGAAQVEWYWGHHRRDRCWVDEPTTVCWCGLKHSEHQTMQGHAEGKALPVEAVNQIDDLQDRIQQYREALVAIRDWDCLNPPATYLCVDFPWLKRLVDTALGSVTGSPPQPPESPPPPVPGDGDVFAQLREMRALLPERFHATFDSVLSAESWQQTCLGCAKLLDRCVALDPATNPNIPTPSVVEAIRKWGEELVERDDIAKRQGWTQYRSNDARAVAVDAVIDWVRSLRSPDGKGGDRG